MYVTKTGCHQNVSSVLKRNFQTRNCTESSFLHHIENSVKNLLNKEFFCKNNYRIVVKMKYTQGCSLCLIDNLYVEIMNLMLSGMMILFGWMFLHKPPKKINDLFGYRTARSSKSQAAWDFAHHYIGGLWFRIGIVLLPLSVIIMLPVLGKGEDMVGLVGGILCLVQVIVMILSIYPTERALKQQFGE